MSTRVGPFEKTCPSHKLDSVAGPHFNFRTGHEPSSSSYDGASTSDVPLRTLGWWSTGCPWKPAVYQLTTSSPETGRLHHKMTGPTVRTSRHGSSGFSSFLPRVNERNPELFKNSIFIFPPCSEFNNTCRRKKEWKIETEETSRNRREINRKLTVTLVLFTLR